MSYNFTDPYEIARFIKEVKKSTPVKVYLKGNLEGVELGSIECYGNNDFYVLFGESDEVATFLTENKDKIVSFRLENDIRNSVSIGDNAVIMMGAVINIGAEIGESTMVDMNAVIGARGKLGKRVHLGAGAVVAGVLEPPSKTPCIIEDDVLIGANAVILEGVKIGKGSVVAAGSVVVEDVPAGVVVAGTPAKIIKSVDEKTKDKTEILDDLRK